MTETLDIFPHAVTGATPANAGTAAGGIANLSCDRCHAERVPWDLRNFGGKSICTTCYGATLELARTAIHAMGHEEPGRICRSCRAITNPALGSAWCGATELGDDRAKICANFVPLHVEGVRAQLAGGRVAGLDAWQAVSDDLKATLGESNFNTWFAAVDPIALEGNDLVLAVPDDYTRDWLEKRLHAVVLQVLSNVGLSHVTPVYRVEPESRVSVSEEPGSEFDNSRESEFLANLNPHYTFAEFIVGSSNRLAHASALACVDKPGVAYNPLVLYGGVGVGKTHLLQAVGQEAAKRKGTRVLYATSETFTNELIHAIRVGETTEFRERYRNVDFLLLDDIQFIAGKEATQEEFFHTFNALHHAGKQIVVTSDRPPTELRVLEDRLRSRFAWGLMADMQPPDFETRMAIVRAKAALRHREVPETVLDALASRGGNNVRELEGALNRILARADLIGTEPGLEIARGVLGDPGTPTGSCTPSDVLQAVASYFRVKASDLAGPHRDRSIVHARQMAMYLLREEAKLSLVDVGQHLGGRNHSTVIYGCDKMSVEIKRKGRVKQDLQAIKQLMYGAG